MNDLIDRRLLLGGAGAAFLIPWAALAAVPGNLVMYHSPGCGCCLEWVKRVEATFRRKMRVVETGDIAAVKQTHGVPEELLSCHTALIGGYVVEGHVPPADIARLVKSKSRIVRGLAVPGMPAGSPGMDVGHDHKQPYKVFAFSPGGRRSVFASYG
jgi:hypothetical protein